MKAHILASCIALVATGCVSQKSTDLRDYIIRDAKTGMPVPNVEFSVLRLKRPYWIAGQVEELKGYRTDSNGRLRIPKGCSFYPAVNSGWEMKEPFSYGPNPPNQTIEIVQNETEPSSKKLPKVY